MKARYAPLITRLDRLTEFDVFEVLISDLHLVIFMALVIGVHRKNIQTHIRSSKIVLILRIAAYVYFRNSFLKKRSEFQYGSG